MLHGLINLKFRTTNVFLAVLYFGSGLLFGVHFSWNSVDVDGTPQSVFDSCMVSEVQLPDGSTATGFAQLYTNDNVEVGFVRSIKFPGTLRLPNAVGFFLRDIENGNILQQGLSTDAIAEYLPWPQSTIEQLMANYK